MLLGALRAVVVDRIGGADGGGACVITGGKGIGASLGLAVGEDEGEGC